MKISTARTLNDGEGSSIDLNRVNALYFKFDGKFYQMIRGEGDQVKLHNLIDNVVIAIEDFGTNKVQSDFIKGYNPIGNVLEKFGLSSEKREVFNQLLSVNQESKSEGELVLQRAAGSLTAIPSAVYLQYKSTHHNISTLSKQESIYVIDLDEECIKSMFGYNRSAESVKETKDVQLNITAGTTSDEFLKVLQEKLDATCLVSIVDLSAEEPTSADINLMLRSQLFVGLSAIKNSSKGTAGWSLLNGIHKDMTLDEALFYSAKLNIDIDSILEALEVSLMETYYEFKLEALLQQLENGELHDVAALNQLREHMAQVKAGNGNYAQLVKEIKTKSSQEWVLLFMLKFGGEEAKDTVKNTIDTMRERFKIASTHQQEIDNLETATIQGKFVSRIYFRSNSQIKRIAPILLGGEFYQRLTAIFSYFILGSAAIAISVLALAVFFNPVVAMVSVPLAVAFTSLCAVSVVSHLAFFSAGSESYEKITSFIKRKEFSNQPIHAAGVKKDSTQICQSTQSDDVDHTARNSSKNNPNSSSHHL
jgi:hypothetical protein